MSASRLSLGDRARQLRDGRVPFPGCAGLTGSEVDPDGPELRGARRLRGAAKNIGPPRNLESHESRGHDGGLQLCFQQSTGDSTLPEIHIALVLRRHRFRNENIADLEPAPRLEYTRHFLKAGEFVGKKVHHAVRDDHICPRVADGQLFGEPETQVEVCDSGFTRAGARPVEHRRRHVDTDNLSTRSDHPRRNDAVDSGAATNVHDALIRRELPQAERIPRAGKGRDRAPGHAVEPAVFVPEQAGEGATGMEVKAALGVGGDGSVFLLNGVAERLDVEAFHRLGRARNGRGAFCHRTLRWTGDACARSVPLAGIADYQYSIDRRNTSRDIHSRPCRTENSRTPSTPSSRASATPWRARNASSSSTSWRRASEPWMTWRDKQLLP